MSKPENAERFATLASFQELLLAVVKSCASIDTREYELASGTRLFLGLRPATLKLLGEARSLLGSLLGVTEMMQRPHPIARSLPPQDKSERRFPHSLVPKPATLASVDEVAFMAQMELGQREERLERATIHWEIAALLGECDSSLRRLRKSLNAVGLTIARVLDVPAPAEYRSELESSLATRKALKGFRKRVTKGGEPTPSQLRDRFSFITNQIEILVSWDMYAGMRVRDRLLLRSLQERALQWLRGVNATPESGMRLWQDIAACVEMFSLVSRRQELVEHDAALLTRCLSELQAHDAEELVDSAFVKQLRAMEGFDPELDALLEQRSLQVAGLRTVLERLAKPFTPSPGDHTSSGELW
ncbi:MAG TPA: hypothetical protein VGI70_17595 [Polyangiales bacterium]